MKTTVNPAHFGVVKPYPTQSMSEFFARSDVKVQQEIQKLNPYGTRTHQDAFLRLRRLAYDIGAVEWIGEY